jgi:hypothetical protein
MKRLGINPFQESPALARAASVACDPRVAAEGIHWNCACRVTGPCDGRPLQSWLLDELRVTSETAGAQDVRSTSRRRIDTNSGLLVAIPNQRFLSIEPLSLVRERPVNGESIAIRDVVEQIMRRPKTFTNEFR